MISYAYNQIDKEIKAERMRDSAAIRTKNLPERAEQQFFDWYMRVTAQVWLCCHHQGSDATTPDGV